MSSLRFKQISDPTETSVRVAKVTGRSDWADQDLRKILNDPELTARILQTMRADDVHVLLWPILRQDTEPAEQCGDKVNRRRWFFIRQILGQSATETMTTQCAHWRQFVPLLQEQKDWCKTLLKNPLVDDSDKHRLGELFNGRRIDLVSANLVSRIIATLNSCTRESPELHTQTLRLFRDLSQTVGVYNFDWHALSQTIVLLDDSAVLHRPDVQRKRNNPAVYHQELWHTEDVYKNNVLLGFHRTEHGSLLLRELHTQVRPAQKNSALEYAQQFWRMICGA